LTRGRQNIKVRNRGQVHLAGNFLIDSPLLSLGSPEDMSRRRHGPLSGAPTWYVTLIYQ
jgi:hypothetical protein